MTRSVSQKMGIKEGMRTYLMDSPLDAIGHMNLPPLLVSHTLEGLFDYLHLFVTSQSTFKDAFPLLKEHLSASGMLWVSWPKNKQLSTDLTLPKVIELGYTFGLVESTCLSINSLWSALKFTHPKKGKTYHNSYGKLPFDTTS